MAVKRVLALPPPSTVGGAARRAASSAASKIGSAAKSIAAGVGRVSAPGARFIQSAGKVIASGIERAPAAVAATGHEALRKIRGFVGAAKHLGLDVMNYRFSDTPSEHQARYVSPDVTAAAQSAKSEVAARRYDEQRRRDKAQGLSMRGRLASDARVHRKAAMADNEVDRMVGAAVNGVARAVDYAKFNRLRDELAHKITPAAMFSFVSGYVRQHPIKTAAMVGAGVAAVKGIKYVRAYLRKRRTKEDVLRAAPLPKQWKQSWKKASKSAKSAVEENSATAFGALLRAGVEKPRAPSFTDKPIGTLWAKFARRLRRAPKRISSVA